MNITSGYGQITAAVRTKNGVCSLVWDSVQIHGPETITIKYLEKGHIFMRADVIHGNIGKLFSKTSTVATVDDFVQLCEKTNNNIKTIVLDLPFT